MSRTDHGRVPADPRARHRRRARQVLVATGAPVALLAVGVTVFLISLKGPREAIPGEVFRSPQPSAADLRRWAEDHRIRTVISLRRADPPNPWLRRERHLSTELGMAHETVPFRPDEWPARHQLARLVTLLEESPRPILIHCLRGVDRSGLGSAVALLLRGAHLEEALAQLSLRRGHLCNPSGCPLHGVLDQYRSFLAETQLAHSAGIFRRWALEMYYPDPYHAELVLEEPPPAALTVGQTTTFRIRVHNRGREPWSLTADRGRGVRLGARIVGPLSEIPDDPIALFRTSSGAARDVGRAGIEEGEIPAGGQRVFDLPIRVPGETGAYVLQIDMVDELVHWFSDLGGPGIFLESEVVFAERSEPVEQGSG